jgi:predicted AAA+ superfamily ATPase
MELINRFFKPPSGSFFLFGPRGTGKTLFLKQYFSDALYIDLLQPETYRSFTAKPERLREVVKARKENTTVIIDEIQKSPGLLPLIHSLIEERHKQKFILTGSSARKLKRSGTDLLAGRALYCEMHPFMASELGSRFNLDEALRYGLLPLVFASDEKEHTLNSYCQLYLKEEVQMEALVRNIGDFSRFLETISFSHGSLVNISNIARECEVKRKTAEGYLKILEDLLLGFQINVFSHRAKRQLTEHPKFYYFDAGIFRTLRSVGPIDTPSEAEGVALEGLIAQHIRAWIGYNRRRNTLYYWRTRNRNEIDFILYGTDGLFAIEVKNGRVIHPQDLRSLKAFKQDYPQAVVLLLYRGKEKMKIDNIFVVPAEEFLMKLHPYNNLATSF